MKKIIALLLAVMLLATVFAGCAAKPTDADNSAANTTEPAADTADTSAEPTKDAEQPAEPTEEAEETKKAPEDYTGEVNIYMASSEDFAIMLKEGFEEAYPNVKMNYVMLGGGEILTRLRAEKDNPGADMVLGGAVDIYMNADADGLLKPFNSPILDDFKEGTVPEDHMYVVDRQSILGICYDKDWYDAKGLAYPTCWDDLLIPELADNVIITNPGTSTTGYMMMSTLIALRGEEAGMQYMIDLDKNIKSYAKGGTGPVNSVSLGEAAAGMCYIQVAIQLQEQGYTNVGVCIPTDGTGVEQGASALIANAENEENAEVFYEWYLTEGLKCYEAVGLYLYPSNRNVPANAVAAEYEKQLKDAHVDYAWAAENYDRLVEEWDAKISK